MSSDKQSAASPDDQIERCRAYAEREGFEVVHIGRDDAISGASRHNRPGLLSLIAEIDEWDVLLVWDSARIARDAEDMGWVRKRLKFHKRRGVEVKTGLDLENVGSKVMGVLNEEYLIGLRADTLRGLHGRANEGLATGAQPYGYRTVEDESGGKRIVIHEDEARTMRRIFNLYRQGEGYRSIVGALNAEGVAPPRQRRKRGKGASWAPSALRSMLLNPRYRGEIIWNKTEWRKDPDTGTRKCFKRPESEWLRSQDEALRIVDDLTFEAVAQTIKARSSDGRHRGAPARYPLSGVLECAECGGSYHVTRGAGGYNCSWHRNRGNTVCTASKTLPRKLAEGELFSRIRDEILSPDRVGRAADRAAEIVRERLAGTKDTSPQDRERLDEIEAELSNLVRQAAKLGDLPEFDALLSDLKAERAELTARLASKPKAPKIDPAKIRRTARRQAQTIRNSLGDSPVAAQGILKALLGKDRIRVAALPGGGFRLDGVFRLSLNPKSAAQDDACAALMVVAGDCYATVEHLQRLDSVAIPWSLDPAV